jgi:hypothetical protein
MPVAVGGEVIVAEETDSETSKTQTWSVLGRRNDSVVVSEDEVNREGGIGNVEMVDEGRSGSRA